jgi:ceramide glucosyltransferase
MMLRRTTLDRVGGFDSVVNCLAEDNILGQRVRALGLEVALAHTMPRTTVAETSLRALWSHERRWMQTIRSVAPPAGLAFSVVQYPLFWAALAFAFSGGTGRSFLYYLATWVVRGMAAFVVTRAVRPSIPSTNALWSILLLPLREILTVLEIAASYSSRTVLWRNQAMTVSGAGTIADHPVELGAIAADYRNTQQFDWSVRVNRTSWASERQELQRSPTSKALSSPK